MVGWCQSPCYEVAQEPTKMLFFIHLQSLMLLSRSCSVLKIGKLSLIPNNQPRADDREVGHQLSASTNPEPDEACTTRDHLYLVSNITLLYSSNNTVL